MMKRASRMRARDGVLSQADLESLGVDSATAAKVLATADHAGFDDDPAIDASTALDELARRGWEVGLVS